MATYEIVTWKDIPAVVEARDERGSVSRQLSERFQALIDSVAMQFGGDTSEAYLEAWTRSDPRERPGAAADVADAVVAEIEARFPEFIARAFRPT
jgi:cvfA/B/C family virulence factor